MKSVSIVLCMLIYLPLLLASEDEYWTFTENFEDSIRSWDLGEGWQVESGSDNKFLSGSRHSWAIPRIDLCYNYSVRFRLRLIKGSCHITFRNDSERRYFIDVNQESLTLAKQVGERFIELKTVRPGIDRWKWHQFCLYLQGEHIRIYLNDKLRMSFTDASDPILAGRFAFESLDESSVWIDDIELTAVKPLQEGGWIRLGGPPGGLGYDIRVHPHDDRIMFVTDNPSGVNKSYDGGRTWVTRNEGISSRGGTSSDSYPIFSLTIDTVDPNIVWSGFQGSRGIFKSYDCGETWTEMDAGIEEDGITIRSFAVDPRNHDVVYAGAEIPTGLDGVEFERVKGKIYKTEDGGRSWFTVWSGGSLIRTILIDPRDSNVIYAASGIFDREAYNRTGIGVLKSTDGGKTWTQKIRGIDNLFVGYLDMHPQNPDVLIAAAGNNALAYSGKMGGVYRTNDGGETWRKILEDDIFTVAVFAPSDPEIVYAGSAGAFYRSEDGGRTWERMAREEGYYGPSGIRAGVPISAVVDRTDPYTVFVNNYGGGCFRSEDGGRTWIESSRGYTGAEIHAVAVDPRDSKIVYAIGRSGPFKSTDGGQNWEGLAYGPANFPEWYDIALNPDNPDHVIVSDEHQGVLLKSRDGGRSWSEVFRRRGISVSPRDRHGFKTIEFAPSDSRIVYAGMRRDRNAVNARRLTPSYGLFKSTDSGETWVDANGDLPKQARNINCIAIDPRDPNRLFIGTLSMGIFASDDGGRRWREMNRGLRSLDVRSLAISPDDPNLLFAGLGEGAGLFVSHDGGETWQQRTKGIEIVCPSYLLPLGGGAEGISYDDRPSVILISQSSYGVPWSMITDIEIDPIDSQKMLLSDAATGVYMSMNGGESWRIVNRGLNMKAVNDLAISADGSAVYAATIGGGVYLLPLDRL